jgi:hypothetical protein
MCDQAKRIFEEYCAAISTAAEAEAPLSERRIRTAIGLLAAHNREHQCCAKLRFEQSAPSRRWQFRLMSPNS